MDGQLYAFAERLQADSPAAAKTCRTAVTDAGDSDSPFCPSPSLHHLACSLTSLTQACLMQVDGQLYAFAEQLQPYSPAGAKACRTAAAEAADSCPPSSPIQPILNRPPEDMASVPGGSCMEAERGPPQIAIQCKRLLPLRTLRSLSGEPCPVSLDHHLAWCQFGFWCSELPCCRLQPKSENVPTSVMSCKPIELQHEWEYLAATFMRQ